MAKKSLPSSVTKRSNNKFVKNRILDFGSTEFNRIFPTLGKIMATKNTNSNTDSNSNNTNNANATINTYDAYKEILENQNTQNVILKRILGEIKEGKNSNNQPNLIDQLVDSLTDIFSSGRREKPRGNKPPSKSRTVPDTGIKRNASPTNRPRPPVSVPPVSAVPTIPNRPAGPPVSVPPVSAVPTIPNRPGLPGNAPPVSASTSGAGVIVNNARTNPPAAPAQTFETRPPNIPSINILPTISAPPITLAPGAPSSSIVRNDLFSRAQFLWNDTINSDAVRIPPAPNGQTFDNDERITSRDRLIRRGQSEFDAAIRANRVVEDARLRSLIDIPSRPSDAQRIQGIPPAPVGPRNSQDPIRIPITQRQQGLVSGPRQPLVGPRPQPNLGFGLRNASIFTAGLTTLTGGSVQDILTNVGIISGLVLADNVVRYMGRALGSLVLREVPIVGTIARVYFAAQRARAEDYIGAFLELSAGVVSLIPVLGTIGSIAIDIITIVRDIINHFAPNLRDLIISPEKQKEIEEFLKPLVLAAIGNLIYNSPEPELSSSNTQLVQNGDLLELYNAARVDSPEGHALYNFIGAETMVGLEQLFRSNTQGNGLLQRNTIPRARETVIRGLQTRQQSLSRRSGSSTPSQSNKDIQEKSADADLIDDQEYEKIIFDADSIKFEGLDDATKNTSFTGGSFAGSDLGSMVRGDISGLGTGIFRGTPLQADSRSRDERAGIAMAFFISKGWTPEQAAGIVGNLVHESGLNTTIIGDRNNSRGPSYGIAQWREVRLRNFEAWSDGKHVIETSFENQLEFVQHELMGTHRSAGQSLRGTNTIEAAALTIRTQYEVPREADANDISRLAYARQYLIQYQRQSQAQPQQTETNSAPSTGVSLSRAGTDMVAADQQGIRVLQGLINSNMLQGTPEQYTTSMPPSNNSKGQNSPTEIPLRFRLESTFSYRPS